MNDFSARNNGFALVSSLIILTILTLLVITAASRNTMDELMAGNQRDSVNAMVVAESGIEAGYAVIRKDHVKAGEFQTTDLQPYISSPLLYESVSGGTYSVTLPQVTTNGVVMNSLGNFTGAEREIEIHMEIDGEELSQHAILTNRDINALSGTPQVTGPVANIHSNADIYIQGNPNIAGDVTASGTVSATGNPSIGGNESSGADVVEIPHVYPPDFRPFATVVMTNNCKVETPQGGMIANLSGGGTWSGWSCLVNQKWMMSGNVHPGLAHEFYYVEGNVELAGNPGGIWYASFVAEGYIKVSGNAEYRSWGSGAGNDTGDYVANEILFLAGNDLMIQGTPSQIFRGIMAAHMEIHVSGNVFLEGSLVAENGLHGMGQEVQSGQTVVDLVVDNNSFEGNMTIVATPTGLIGGGNPAKMTAWRELLH